VDDPNLIASSALLIGAGAFFIRMVTPAIIRVFDAFAVRLKRSDRIDALEKRIADLEDKT